MRADNMPRNSQRDDEELTRTVEQGFVLGLKARITELENALNEAADDIHFWGDYATEYFQDRHNLKRDIDKYRAIAKGEDNAHTKK